MPHQIRLGISFWCLQCIYVDDGAIIFTTRANLKKGLELIYMHFACFGLEMHIGKGNSPSKTDRVFFPPPGFLTHTYLLSNKKIPTLKCPWGWTRRCLLAKLLSIEEETLPSTSFSQPHFLFGMNGKWWCWKKVMILEKKSSWKCTMVLEWP